MSDNRSDLMTRAEVARIFGVDPKTVSRWAQLGKIASIRNPGGGHYRFRRTEIEALAGIKQ